MPLKCNNATCGILRTSRHMNNRTWFILLDIIVTGFTLQGFTTCKLLRNELEIQTLPRIRLMHLSTHVLQHCFAGTVQMHNVKLHIGPHQEIRWEQGSVYLCERACRELLNGESKSREYWSLNLPFRPKQTPPIGLGKQQYF